MGAHLAIAALALAVALTACSRRTPADTSAGQSSQPSPGAVPAVAARPTRTPVATLASPLAPGTASVEPGPFTDRVVLTGLALAPGARPRLTGRLTVTSDVSELMALEIAADFYDAQGRLVGSATQVVQGHSVGGPEHEDEQGNPSEAVDINIASATPFQLDAVAAIVTVPQLVNE